MLSINKYLGNLIFQIVYTINILSTITLKITCITITLCIKNKVQKKLKLRNFKTRSVEIMQNIYTISVNFFSIFGYL